MRRLEQYLVVCLLCCTQALSGEPPEAPTPNIPDQTIATSANRSVARIAEQAALMLPRQEYQDALATAETGIQIDPVYIPLWRIKAAAETALGLYDAAEESLFVCLLKNPRDLEANILSLINTVRRPNLPEQLKLKEISDLVWAVDENLGADIVGAFMQRPDFPEYLSVILSAWRSSSSVIDQVRNVLDLYANASFADAKVALDALPLDAIKPTLAAPLSRLVGEGSITQESLWSVDLGSQRVEDGDLVLSAPPTNQAFSWFRLSSGWRNVQARLATNGDKSENKSLYLRFTASDSYLRITLAGNTIMVQERVPEFGLSNILELPLAAARGQDLELILKGERLSLLAEGKSLTDSPLPVTGILKQGKAAIGVLNVGSIDSESHFSRLGLRKIDDCWQAIEPGLARSQLDRLLLDTDLTGILVAVGTNADANLASLLLSAGNAGLSNYAVLPAGSMNLDSLRAPFARLPKTLADRIWSGVVVRPGAIPDWQAVGDCIARIKASNLEALLFLGPDEANALSQEIAAGQAGFEVDWVLFNSPEAIPQETRANLNRIYRNSLSNSHNYPRQFRR